MRLEGRLNRLEQAGGCKLKPLCVAYIWDGNPHDPGLAGARARADIEGKELLVIELIATHPPHHLEDSHGSTQIAH